MQKDFHYFAIYRLAVLAGFAAGEAETIAYASQYVDDSTESEPVEPFKDQYFDTARTAHYNLEAFNWNVQKKIYLPFHFLPKRVRWNSPRDFSYITEPAAMEDSELAAILVKDALSEGNRRFRLIRLGVAIHTIADTFSHFGFSGRHHDENDVGRIWHADSRGGWKLKFFESYADIFVPKIGHTEAFTFPDRPYLKWRYSNHGGKKLVRDNLKHCADGVKTVYRVLRSAAPSDAPEELDAGHPAEFKKMQSLFRSKGDLDGRCRQWKQYAGAPDYDRTRWRREALKGDVEWDNLSRSAQQAGLARLKGKVGFDNSKWAFFHRAALKQRNLVIEALN
jgi:hypothetical protein